MTHNGAVTRPDAKHWLIAIVVLAAGLASPIYTFLIAAPPDQWQVDVQVYREAGVSILQGRPVYQQMTEPPQLLPFTYPPVAALIFVPLALVPFWLAAVGWNVAQVLANIAIAVIAWHLLMRRVGPWWPVVAAAIVGAFMLTQPVADGIRFAQVNAFLVLACLVDLRRPRLRVVRWLPPGVLVGLAMAIKLTPGVFVIHYLVCRRWREAATAIGTAVFASVMAWLVLPTASFAFWGGALQDPNRLGPNDGSANQAFRALLLRRGLDGGELLIAWAPYLLVIGGIGFWLARRAYQRGDWLSEVAMVGLLGFLLSPVSWMHHLHWIMVIVPAILGPTLAQSWRQVRADGRWRRWLAALVVWGWFTVSIPFTGVLWLRYDRQPREIGHLLIEGNVLGSLIVFALLGWAILRPIGPDGEPPGHHPAAREKIAA